MSFRDWTRTSEQVVLKTAPDVRRSKGGGDRSLTSRSTSASHIPVIQRRRMFEDHIDSVLPERSSSTSGGPGHKRSNRTSTRKEINRSSSFRASKRMKVENDSSPVLLRNKQFQSGSIPAWQKLRNFGHFDLQSVGIDKFLPGCQVTAEHNVKKATGASAAASADDGVVDTSNELVASCPAFKTDIGGDYSVNGERDFLYRLKDHLSYDKRKRLCTREKLLFDGKIPIMEPMISETKSLRHTTEILHAKPAIHYPFEFIDYGASYYRNYFLHEGMPMFH